MQHSQDAMFGSSPLFPSESTKSVILSSFRTMNPITNRVKLWIDSLLSKGSMRKPLEPRKRIFFPTWQRKFLRTRASPSKSRISQWRRGLIKRRGRGWPSNQKCCRSTKDILTSQVWSISPITWESLWPITSQVTFSMWVRVTIVLWSSNYSKLIDLGGLSNNSTPHLPI